MYPIKWAFANSGGTAEILFGLCPVFKKGQRRFFIFGGIYYETMANFKIIFVKTNLF